MAEDRDAIFISSPTRKSANLIAAHEAYHAYFFSNKTFQKAVETFWRNALSGDERDQWREALGAIGYNSKDDYLMYNEFQAFNLQPAGAEYMFSFPAVAKLIVAFAPKIRAYMSKNEILLLHH